MGIVIKTIGNRQYRYSQTSQRKGGKVVTNSKYIGPVNPRRKKKDGFGFFAAGLASLAVAGMKGELKPYNQAQTPSSKHPRSIAAEREKFEEGKRRANEEGKLHIPPGAKAHVFKGNDTPKHGLNENDKKEFMDWAKGVSERATQAPPAPPASQAENPDAPEPSAGS